MKLIHIDEAGTDRKDTKCVVAAIIVDADQQFRTLEEMISSATKKHIPDEIQSGFIFHAKDIYGKQQKKFGWSIEKCNEITNAWLDIVRESRVPFCLSWVSKPNYSDGKASAGSNTLSHAVAFGMVLAECDKHLKSLSPNEIASVVAEDTAEMRRHLTRLHREMTAGEWDHSPVFNNRGLSQIKNTVHFSEKQDAVLLQLADVLAFSFKRYLNVSAGGHKLYARMMGKPDGWDNNLKAQNNGCVLIRWKHILDEFSGLG